MSKRKSGADWGSLKPGPAKKPRGKKLAPKWADFRTGDDSILVEGPEAEEIFGIEGPTPTKDKNGCLKFSDYPQFKPNRTPREIIEEGAFGGCYFRPIKSSVCDDPKKLKNQHLEFDFFNDIPDDMLCLQEYDTSKNKHKVTCGGSLQMWQSKGWISPLDPYGWFQWYCRFYNGRRSTDDDRQVNRWLRCTGPKGRWKNTLLTKIIRAEKEFDDASVSPAIRQTLLHWGYVVTPKDLEQRKKQIAEKA